MVGKRYPLVLDGVERKGGKWRPVACPFDRETVGEVRFAGVDDLEFALKLAQRRQTEMARTPVWKRVEVLKKAASLIRERAEKLALLIATEGGKPLKDAIVEARRAAVTLEQAGAAAEKLEGREWGMQRAPGTENRLAFTVCEPIGVVLAISAFNHPLNLPCHQAGAAIAAGNAVILKPASSTPMCSLELGQIFAEAGLPAGTLQVLPAAGRDAEVLVRSPFVRFVTFIGSGEVGWSIRRQVADGTRMAAEHGGNAASIVLGDADLDRLIPPILRGSFYHAGQVCVSTQRIYVEKSLESEFTERFIDGARQQVVGDAREAKTDVGPLIEPEEVARVDRWVKEALATGTECLLGGEPLSATLYGTTVLRGAAEDAKVIANEVFGPVVTIQPVDGLDEAIQKVNRSENPFQSSVFTQDIDKALQAARSVHAAAFMINDITAFRVDWMPFGGRQKAGLALGGLEHATRDMTEEKLIVINPAG